MLGLVLVTVAITASLLIKALVSVVRGREFHVSPDEVAWYVLALAVVTNFFGLIPGSMVSISAALNTVMKLLRLYNGLMSTLTLLETVISIAANLGLPIAGTAASVLTEGGVVSSAGLMEIIEITVEVLEHLVSLVFHYLAHVFSIIITALWFAKYALIIGATLRALMPYLAPFLVLPRVRNAAIIPIAMYLVLGIALPLGINTTHAQSMTQTRVMNITKSLAIPSGLGFINVEITDSRGTPLPSILCISGFGFPYNETVGLPSGKDIIMLPIFVGSKAPVSMYVINCVVALFVRFNANYYVVPATMPQVNPYIIRLPMIGVFNGSSLVALFNYTWNGPGKTTVAIGNGYAIINITAPCSGELTVNAYASEIKLLNVSLPRNCSITYTTSTEKPQNAATQDWLNNVWVSHEEFCQDIEQLLNPSITYEPPELPPQVIYQLMSTMKASCSGIGNYSNALNELRSLHAYVSFRCLGNCGLANISVAVIGVEPYSLNYYALWGGTFVMWLNTSLLIFKNVLVSPISPGLLISMVVNTAYSMAMVLGIVGLIAIAPRIRFVDRLMEVTRVRLRVGYEDVIGIASAVTSKASSHKSINNSVILRYRVLNRLRSLTRHKFMRHLIRAGTWALRDLPKISTAPYVLLPAMYGLSVARDYVIRRISVIENRALREALNTIAAKTLTPRLILAPYSVPNVIVTQSMRLLTRHTAEFTRDVVRTYTGLRNYLTPTTSLFIALRSVIDRVHANIISSVGNVWSSMKDPINTLAAVSNELSQYRIIDRELAGYIAREALSTLVSRFGGSMDFKVIINGREVGPSDVTRVSDYEDVQVRVGDRDVFVKAWVVKEFVRVVYGRRA
ncbi:MAG: hypothetical protein ACP5GY_05025 [Vulcanisaeta sp.]